MSKHNKKADDAGIAAGVADDAGTAAESKALPLKAVDMPSHMAAPAPSAGYAPEVAWVSLSDLVVDGRYQRPVTRSGLNTIHRIMWDFRWARFAPCIVTRIAEGRYAIIDGQHRCTAALSLGFERVPCAIVKADAKEAAAIFAAVNGVVTPMSAQMVYKAALFAGEGWAERLQAITAKHGVEILFYPVQRSAQRPLQTMAVGTLRKLLARHGAAKLDQVLATVLDHPQVRTPGFIDARVLAAAAHAVVAGQPMLREATPYSRLGGETSTAPSLPAEPPPGLVVEPNGARVRDLKRMGRTRQEIAALTRLSLAEIERHLTGDPS
jgi:ParB-like nuclease domain